MGTKRSVLIAVMGGGAALTALAQLLTTPLVAPGTPDQAVVSGQGSNAPSALHGSLMLSNRAVMVLSKLRGTEPGAVKLNSGTNGARFEVEVAKTADVQKEAATLSAEFGASASIVLDEVAADGRFRTNFVFRNGAVDKRVVPANLREWKPDARRLLIRPEGTVPAAPSTVRFIQ